MDTPPDEKLKGRCDSFVVETDVEYPTDIRLLFDAVRKIIERLILYANHWGFLIGKRVKKKFANLRNYGAGYSA